MLALAVMTQPWTWVFGGLVVLCFFLAVIGVTIKIGRSDPQRVINLVALGLLIYSIFYFWNAIARAPKG